MASDRSHSISVILHAKSCDIEADQIALIPWAAKETDQVALEAGNSPSIIFKHYRELTTEEQAEKWFSIMPKEGQWENTLSYDRKKRRVILNGIERD